MKNLLFISVLILFLVSENLCAQRMLHGAVKEMQLNKKSGNRNPQSSLSMRPVFETDSFYDVTASAWDYTGDKLHTYYQSNCLDSVVTETYMGSNTYRFTYQYEGAPYFYNTYQLTQTWDGSAWQNYLLYINPSLPFSCFYDYIYNLQWNGFSWDTTYGRKTTQYAVDGYGNPIFIERKKYVSPGVWVNYMRWDFGYDTNHQLNMQEYSRWDTAVSQFNPIYREINYTYNNYTSLCVYSLASYEYQTWDGSQWQNNSKYFYRNQNADTLFILNWNGSSYSDSSQMIVYEQDLDGNFAGEADYYYNGSWVLDYFDWHYFTYDINNNIIRDENDNDFYSTADSIFPNTVALYSNFQPCAYTVNVPGNESGENFWKIYPNPTTDNFTITFSNQSPSIHNQLKIYDVTGRIVHEQKLNNQSTVINNQFSSGVYFVRVSCGERVFTQKLVIQ